MYASTHGVIPDEIADEMTQPGDAPDEGVHGLGGPRVNGVAIPTDFEHRISVQDAPTRFARFAEMRRTSSAVRIGDRALHAAVRQARWTATEGDDVDQASVDLVAEQFGLGAFKRGRLRRSLRSIVAQALRAVTDGSVFLAAEWALIDGRWWIVDYHVRHVQSFTDLYQDGRGRLVGFRQQVDGATDVVPMRACLYITDSDDEGHFGFGLNRTALPAWEDEQDGLKNQRAAVRRFAFGTPVTGVRDLEAYSELRRQAEQAGKDLAANWMAEYDAAQVNSVRGLLASRNGYVKREWWQTVEILEANFEPAKLDATILARQVEIARIYAAGFIYQGSPGYSGDQSMVVTQAAELLSLADLSLERIADAINRQAVEQLHAYNLPGVPVERRAQLAYTLPRPRDQREVADYVALVAAGAITQSAADERAFRAAREWPEMEPEAEARGPVERGAQVRRAAPPTGPRAAARATADEAFQQGRAQSRQEDRT